MEISNLLDSVNQRSNLEERVINIGLSNNYFKNVAEIFKKTITLWDSFLEQKNHIIDIFWQSFLFLSIVKNPLKLKEVQ